MPELDLSKGTIPVLLFIAAIVASISGGAYIGRMLESNDLTRTQLAELAVEVKELSAEVRNLVTNYRPDDVWSKTEHLEFCISAERVNPGWKCPNKLKRASR
jgi:hypothetical protein